MPVPSSINDLSTTAGANSPSGSETPGQGDDYLRFLSACLAQIRDKLNGTSDTGTIKNPVFSGASTGTLTLAGATLPTPIITGTPEFQGSAVNWAATTTHDGAHVWSGAQTFNGAVSFATPPAGITVSAVKTATTSRASVGITLTNDPHLVAALSVGVWYFEAQLFNWATTSTAGGFAVGVGFSGTQSNGAWTVDSGGSIPVPQAWTNSYSTGSALVVGTGVNGSREIFIRGSLTVSVAGSIAIQWAQEVSNANAANVGIGSSLKCIRLA